MSELTDLLLDASVLINLLHVRRLDLLTVTGHFRPVVPEDVLEEIRLPDQREVLAAELEVGRLRLLRIEHPDVLEAAADLRSSLGRGEAACLALAQQVGGSIACDEKGAFLRLARERIGEGRLVTTPQLVLVAIRHGVLSVDEADSLKAHLEAQRFRMPFASFRDLLR
jgi:predicted nucleic acid-binding protein